MQKNIVYRIQQPTFHVGIFIHTIRSPYRCLSISNSARYRLFSLLSDLSISIKKAVLENITTES